MSSVATANNDRIAAVVTPEPVSDFAAVVAAACPGFVAGEAIGPARKSELLAGRIGDRAVVAKRLKKPNAVWEWYLDHEVAVYRAFAVHPSGVRTPGLVYPSVVPPAVAARSTATSVAAKQVGITAPADELLVIDRLAGEAVAKLRRPNAALPIRVIAALIAVHDQLARYAPKVPFAVTPPRVRAQMRERLLEDPSDPLWIRDGVRLCGKRNLLDEDLSRRIDQALAAYPATSFNHGDLLLRNAIADPDDEEDVALVDWECAGVHLRDWDLALLWTQLAGPARTIVEDAVRDSGLRWRAFLGMVAFAFARELKFLDAYPHNEVARAAVTSELAIVAGRFAEA